MTDMKEARAAGMRALAIQLRDCEKMAAWLDYTYPHDAPHRISLKQHYARDNDTDIAEIKVWSSDENWNHNLESEEIIALLMSRMSYKIEMKSGFDLIPNSRSADAKRMSNHEKMSATAEISKILERDIEP